MFNMHNGYYSENVIYSPVPGGLNLATYEGSTSISVSDSTPVYIDGTKTSFSKASSLIAVGDTAYMFYDSLSRLKYIYIGTSSLKGPFVIASPSSWYKTISGASNESTIMKNGYEITSKELCINDILYFSPSLNTAFVYNDKVIGILESATPSKEAPDTVKVSGTSYKLETADVSFINSDLGDTVVLCLGRNGKIAHSYSASLENLGGFLTDTGIKSFAGSNGDSYTSNYARLTLADGTQIDCATDYDYNSWINKVMSVTFDGGKARLSVISSPGTVSGVVDAQKLKIGSHKLSSDVKILDVGYIEEDTKPCHKSVYLQRIDGLTLSKSDILYAKTENGIITEIILNNVTGDALSYGIITLANSNINGFNASGSYSCDIKGTTYSYSGGVYTNLSKGSVVSTVISDGRLTSFKKLNVNSANVKEITYTYALLSNGTKLTLSDDVAVYKRTGNYDYTHLPLSEVVENSSSYINISVYTDKSEDRGGRVRVILVR